MLIWMSLQQVSTLPCTQSLSSSLLLSAKWLIQTSNRSSWQFLFMSWVVSPPLLEDTCRIDPRNAVSTWFSSVWLLSLASFSWFLLQVLICNTPRLSSSFLGVSCFVHVKYPSWCRCRRIYPNVPIGVAWNGNNIGGATKRAVGIAMHVGFGNLGGVIAGLSFRSEDAPHYFSGQCLLMVTMSLLLCIFMQAYLVHENTRRDIEMVARGLTLDSYTEEMKFEERGKGDDATVS